LQRYESGDFAQPGEFPILRLFGRRGTEILLEIPQKGRIFNSLKFYKINLSRRVIAADSDSNLTLSVKNQRIEHLIFLNLLLLLKKVAYIWVLTGTIL